MDPRSTPVETIARAKVADADTRWTVLREGKRQCVWSEAVQVKHERHVLAARRVYRLSERIIDRRNQQMLLPEYVLEGWTSTLPQAFTPESILAL